MNRKIYWNDEETIETIVKKLREEQIVVGTSDTILGLIAPLTQQGFESLNAIKGRSDKPYLVLVGNQDQANQFTDVLTQEPLKTLVKNCWPGPLTLIVPAKKSVPQFATSSSNTIALRIPDHPGLQAVAAQMGGAFSTSANLANQPIPQTIEELDPAIANSVALLIDDREQPIKKPSTILDCTGDTAKLIREGAYTKTMLQNYLPTIT